MKKICSRIFLPLVLPIMISVALIYPNISQAQEAVLGDLTTIDETQMILLTAKPSVVQVTNIVTGEIILQATVAAQLQAPALSGRSYPFTLGATGSGFFITPDGYLITNGHVANPSDDLIAYYSIVQQTETIYKDALRVLGETYYGYTLSDAELDIAFQEVITESYGGDIMILVNEFYVGYRAGELKVDSVKKSNYIQTGVVSGTEVQVKQMGKVATLIDSPYEGDADSRDLALLKVDGNNFPTIGLGSFENVQIGKEVYAIGYPAVVEELMGVLTDVESELEPSITKGIISAKKKLVDGTEAFQTDAGITHGNSGGPAIDTNGDVIGVATWGFGDEPGGESFNFLISVEKVEDILSKNNVSPSESVTTQTWEEALNLYSQKCYTDAKEKFESVKNLYPDNVDVDEFITKCQGAIERGEDECITDWTTWALIGGGVCCFGLIVIGGIVLLTVLKKKKGKKKSE